MLLISLLLATLLSSALSLFLAWLTAIRSVRFKLILATHIATLLFSFSSFVCCLF